MTNGKGAGGPKGAGGGRGGAGSPGSTREEHFDMKQAIQKLEQASLYAGSDGAPNADLFEEIAELFAEGIRKQGLKDNTQLRRWFNAVDELNNKAVRGILTDDHIRAEMALLRARIAYAAKRPGVRVPQALVSLVTIGSKKVNNARDLTVFRHFFECVVAYHRAGA